MPIIQTQLLTTGTNSVNTNFLLIQTNDLMETVVQPGYLNKNLFFEDISLVSKYQSALVYTTDYGATTFAINFNGPVISLIQQATLWEGGSTEGNILQIFRSSADGKFLIVSDASIYAASILTTEGPNAFTTNQMEVGKYILLDKAVVTQQTSGTTAVTANAQCGVITTFALAFAAGANATFTLNNDKIFANSSIVATVGGGTNTVKNISVSAAVTGVGTASIVIVNNSISSTNLNGTVVVNFVVF
ncbi:MAG: hypothetical protein [Caudoviricetes sp.]|nr:MAG: hypothetical protein [Caudoviricetes sp.]